MTYWKPSWQLMAILNYIVDIDNQGGESKQEHQVDEEGVEEPEPPISPFQEEKTFHNRV